ncbi:hypothetical protein [Yimella sp. cx-51]|uniref:hypothetical protein n=1 Tax=Yimella sp. cx-51 TaxID=2770551 RepID=UPI00165D6FA0|nr:hypothetical protein [Yimella sp. cx-51]MBC9957936.1 hypothetical protein [Yimella sp. cx-51]QTH38070.1 hypothetical protein J5M86_14770 [Yimella sp. cx-51]
MSTQQRLRRTPAPWWFATLAAIPLVFGVIGAQASKNSVEQELTQNAEKVLQGIGAAGASASFEGRDATVTPGSMVDPSRVEQAIADMPGVRSVVVKAAP